MIPLKKLFTSTLGRKYLMGATGFALALFMVIHLLENLTLYSGSGDAINTWAALLDSLGIVKTFLELGLGATILLHIVVAIQVTYSSKAARPVAYDSLKTKGGATKNTVTSRNMIVTGIVLLVFLIIHLKQFRFGPHIEDGYTSMVDGRMILDLYRIVAETFADIRWVIFYVVSMFFLGFHYRHGFWSAFQSLGMMNPRWSKPIYALGLIIAILLTVGFLFIPIFMYSTQAGGAT